MRDPVASRCGVWKQMVDQWALITGASSGIGAEFARQLAARGMHLILTARRTDLMEELAAELRTRHATKCEIIPCDLSRPGAVPNLLEEIQRRGLTVQMLVNNAGFSVVGEVDDAPVERLLQLIQLNISALVELTYRLLPGMLARRSGAVINVSSLSGFQPVAYMAVYAASKAFVLHFSEALAIELRDRKVAMLAVCPGVTRTAFFDIAGAPGWLQKHASQSPEEVVRIALKALGRRRMVVVPGWRNWLLTLVVRFASRQRVVKESMRFFRPRRTET
jgi:short-subunit dehydrogenase